MGRMVRFRLARETGKSSFATRAAAADIRARLSALMSELHAQDGIDVDLSRVEAMTISYADELVAKLAAERRSLGIADTFFQLSNGSSEIVETIAVALERRGLFAMHDPKDGRPELLGAPDHLQVTFDVALKLEEFTAGELANELDINLPAANNRIRQLAEIGAVIRTRVAPAHGGRQYLYQIAA